VLPFAYPPLALYLMALAVHAVGIPVFTYLRLAPVVFLALEIAGTYLLAKEITGSRIKGVVAGVLVGISTDVLYFHLGAGGVVRTLASVWTVLGLVFAWKAMARPAVRTVTAAGVFFGLTALTHPTNAAFFVLSLLAFVSGGPNVRDRVLVAAAIGVGGLVVSAPWWGTVLSRHGAEVFLLASQTHNSVGAVLASGPSQWILRPALVFFPTIGESFLLLHAAAILGAFHALARRQWIWPVWLVATAVFAPDGMRFFMQVGGLVAAVLIVDLLIVESRLEWPGVVAGALLAIHVYYYQSMWPQGVVPLFDEPDLRLASWMNEHTAPTARLLVVPRRHPPESDRYSDAVEWLPYLTKRTVVVAPWGWEWLGSVKRQSQLLFAEMRCRDRQSLACLEDVMREAYAAPDHLLVQDQPSLPGLRGELERSTRWVSVFDDGASVVWRRVSAGEGAAEGGDTSGG
jgi:hypothetical protein